MLTQWISIALLFLISGCSLFDSKKDQVPLPGKRVSVFGLPQETAKGPGRLSQMPWPGVGASGPWLQAYRLATHDAGLCALPPHLSVAWSTNPGSSGPVLSPPLLAKGCVYSLNADGHVYALNTKGKTLWATPVDTSGLPSGGIAEDSLGKLYVTTGSRELVCLDSLTGKCCWRSPMAAPAHGAPVVSQGRVVCLNLMNQTEAFDTKTGQPLWEHTGICTETHILGGSTPAIDGSSVITAHSSGEVVALSLETGEVLWQQSGAPISAAEGTYQLPHIRAHPVIHKGCVYTISYNGQLSCFVLGTGELLWKQAIGGIHTPVIVGTTLYCLSNSNCLVAVDATTGALLWSRELPAHGERGSSWAGPIAAGRFLYVTGLSGKMLALDPQRRGATVKTYDLHGETGLPPVVSDGRLCVVTSSGTLILFCGQ